MSEASEVTFKGGDRVFLTAAVRADRWKSLYVGARWGRVERVEGKSLVVQWDGLDSQSWIRPGDVEGVP